MSEYSIRIRWVNHKSDFAYETYDRTHEVTYGGGLTLKASSAPEYAGDKNLVNPEEMLAASLSSCHMLTFLAIAAKSKVFVKSYTDHATAYLGKNPLGKLAVIKIALRPKIEFEGSAPDHEKLKSLHEKAHANCFIANSITCEWVLES